MNPIRKLRRRFIALATLAVCIILIGALGLINGIGYYTMKNHCLDTMAFISENGGTMPSRYHRNPSLWIEDILPGFTWAEDTPEFAFQTRYFSIHLNENREITAVNVKNIYAFSENPLWIHENAS